MLTRSLKAPRSRGETSGLTPLASQIAEYSPMTVIRDFVAWSADKPVLVPSRESRRAAYSAHRSASENFTLRLEPSPRIADWWAGPAPVGKTVSEQLRHTSSSWKPIA